MAARPLNYTTTIDPGKSAIECIGILMEHGARNVSIAVGEDKVPDGLEFVIPTAWGPRQYALPVNASGTEKALWAAYQDGGVSRRFTGAEQGRRVAWRVLKDWLEAQLALIESGLADLPQVMLPWMKVSPAQTVYGAWTEDETRALEAGK